MNQNLCMVQYRKCMSIICFLKNHLKKRVMDCLNTKEHKHHDVTRMSKAPKYNTFQLPQDTDDKTQTLKGIYQMKKKIMGNYNLKKNLCPHCKNKSLPDMRFQYHLPDHMNYFPFFECQIHFQTIETYVCITEWEYWRAITNVNFSWHGFLKKDCIKTSSSSVIDSIQRNKIHKK